MRSAVVVANEMLEKANADLDADLLSAADRKALLSEYARTRNLADFAITELSQGR